MIINLVVGDWSGDGHEKSDTLPFEVNTNIEMLKAAYTLGAAKCGVDIALLCSRYEHSHIIATDYNKLVEAGITWGPEEDAPDEDEGRYLLWPDSYAILWLKIAQLGDNTLTFERINARVPTVNIGGYGLYY